MKSALEIRRGILFGLLAIVVVVLFAFDLASGSVGVGGREVWALLTGGPCDPMARDIILKIRLIKAVVAVLAGFSLAASGLLMQTLFRNPLAGIGGHSLQASVGTAGAAWIGSALILLLIMAVSRRIKDIMVILILGMMFGSAVGALVEILQYMSNEAALKSFVVWTMGSLGDVTIPQLTLLVPAVAVGTGLTFAVLKPLNLLLLGERYARTMGLNVGRTRTLIFLATTLLSGTVTAFCGPIGFVGLAVPHLARMLFASADHRVLMPASMLLGAAMLLVCDLCSKQLALPVNTLTALMGIPIVVWVVVHNKNIV